MNHQGRLTTDMTIFIMLQCGRVDLVSCPGRMQKGGLIAAACTFPQYSISCSRLALSSTSYSLPSLRSLHVCQW